MKTFSPTQEQALRVIVADTLVDFGLGPRSTKVAPSKAERLPPQTLQVVPKTEWPANDEVLLTMSRVCQALKISRSRLYELRAQKRLVPICPGRTPLYRPSDVYAFIDQLAKEAA